MNSERVIVVCADDFGQSEGVNEAVLEGVQAGWLSAVSCLSTGPVWEKDAVRLQSQAAGRAELGLHFNLTERFNAEDECYGLRALILRAYGRQLPVHALRATFARQLKAFEDTLGCAPDFVDGHQHVHQLPVVRDVVIEALAKRYGAKRPWLRDSAPPRQSSHSPLPAPARGKRAVLAALGAGRLRRLATQRGFVQNQGLLGVYGFDADETGYLSHLQAWLGEAGDRSLLMCHPGLGDMPGDAIAAARRCEYAVLRGQGFAKALQNHHLRVGRLAVAPASQQPGHNAAFAN
ncbi:MAG: ChbG/HpnK family deacetylase [Paucibacter sp.]|nr:ChbG/HpnK family deacetylase [Roseateles sp.]